MIDTDQLTAVQVGGGYTVGEMAGTHPSLSYLKQGAIVTLFDGVDVALDYVTKHMPNAKRSGSSADTGRGSFQSFETYEEAVDTFRHKADTLVKFDPAEMAIKDESEAGNNVEYDVTGSYIDMGRYMEGIPESVGTMHSGNARNRRVTVMVNIGNARFVSNDDINHKSERIIRLVDALEAGGVRTELIAVESSQCNHTEIKIKGHDESLVISDLAAVTHSDWLRRIQFRIIEHSKTFQLGYGSSVVLSEVVSPEMIQSDNVEELVVFIDVNITGKTTIDKRFDEVERLLVWEMSKPVPEVTSILMDSSKVAFADNGSRDKEEIKREGREVLSATD